MPVRFTYANFPSLWDMIISEADFSARLTIRSINHGLRDVIDRLTVRHLILSPEMGNVVNVRGPFRRAPALMGGLSSDSNPSDRVRSLCSSTSVLELRGYFHPTFDLAPIAALFTDLDMLRITPDHKDMFTPYVPFSARTLVLFSIPEGLSGIYEHWYFRHPSESSSTSNPSVSSDEDVGVRRLIPRGTSRRALPPSYRKLVLNLNGCGQPPARLWPIAAVPPSHVEEIVIVAMSYTNLEDGGRLLLSPIASSNVIAVGLLQLLRAPHVRYTLVGLDEVADGFVQSFKELLFQDTAQLVHADVDYARDDPLTEVMHAGLRAFAQEASRAMRRAAGDVGEADAEEPTAEVDNAGEADGEKQPAEDEGTAAPAGAEEAEDGTSAPPTSVLESPTGTDHDLEDKHGDKEPRVEVEPAPSVLETSASSYHRTTVARHASPTHTPTPSASGSEHTATPELAVGPAEASETALMSLQEKVQSVFARIEFLTKKQYMERVGEETAALEMLEYLDPKEFALSLRHADQDT